LTEVTEEVTLEAQRLATAQGVDATVLVAEDPDPVASIYRMRGYDVVLALRAPPGAAASGMASAVGELASRVDSAIHRDLSAALGAEENRVVPAPSPGSRFMALMRRKAGTTHDEYVDYYRTKHARFGIECPGALGYHQNYVDPEVSRQVSEACGFGVFRVDSVTEIFVHSAQAFNEATVNNPIREEAGIDEARFIDRGSMAGFCVRVGARFS
jgi:hypothetical protein